MPAAFSAATSVVLPTAGRAGALITAGLASWMLGQYERANDEWAEAYRIATRSEPNASTASLRSCGHSRCSASTRGRAQVGGGEHRAESRRSASSGPRASPRRFDGILLTVTGDLDAAQARYTEALEIQRRLGDQEGAGVSLGGLAELASGRGDLAEALDLYRRSLAAFEAIGDRAEEARILSETAWTQLGDHDPALAHRTFLDSVRAYTDVASVRGVGLSLIGLAATEAVEQRPETAVQIAAAAEVYAGQEGIVNVYSDETPGREFSTGRGLALCRRSRAARRRPAAGSRSRKHSIWPEHLKRPR